MADVLERKVIHAGDVFIKAGKKNDRAYLIQQGKVSSFVMRAGERVDVAEHGAGAIIGELCLAMDEDMRMSYEALIDTTVASVTREDFQKMLKRIDGTAKNIFNQVLKKLYIIESGAIENAVSCSEMDDDAFNLVRALLAEQSPDNQFLYEKAILPHMNGLIKAIKKIKQAQRHSEQAAAVEEKTKKLKED